MAKLYVSNKDETPRMFKNDFLESLSKVHWTVPLLVYIPVVVYFGYLGYFIFQIPLHYLLVYFVIGVFIWTLAEYGLHRWVFHFVPNNEIGKRLHFIFHGVHHDYPKDSRRLVMPPSASIPLALLFYGLFYFLLGEVVSAPFFAGFIAGYLFYDTTHYAIHHFNMKSKFWLSIKNHHMIHHYRNPDMGFGVSQPIWDYVFGTQYPKTELKENN